MDRIEVFILLAEAMIYEFHTFSMNLFLMFEFNCVAEEREAGAPHSSAARAQLQVVIFKGDIACLQAINLTAFTTGDLVFMGGKKFLPVQLSP